jgi:hypothetical protein
MSLLRLLCGVLLLAGFDARAAPPSAIEVTAVKAALLAGEPLVLLVTVRSVLVRAPARSTRTRLRPRTTSRPAAPRAHHRHRT